MSEQPHDPIFRAMFIGAAAASLIGAITAYSLNATLFADGATLFALPFAVFITLAPTVSLAITLGPAFHRFALRKGWTRGRIYTLAGAATGFAAPALVYLVIWGANIFAAARGEASINAAVLLPLAICAYGGIVGGLTGFFAWLIRRPDRDQPNPANHRA